MCYHCQSPVPGTRRLQRGDCGQRPTVVFLCTSDASASLSSSYAILAEEKAVIDSICIFTRHVARRHVHLLFFECVLPWCRLRRSMPALSFAFDCSVHNMARFPQSLAQDRIGSNPVGLVYLILTLAANIQLG